MNYEKMMEWEECECSNMRKQRYKLHNRVTRIRDHTDSIMYI